MNIKTLLGWIRLTRGAIKIAKDLYMLVDGDGFDITTVDEAKIQQPPWTTTPGALFSRQYLLRKFIRVNIPQVPEVSYGSPHKRAQESERVFAVLNPAITRARQRLERQGWQHVRGAFAVTFGIKYLDNPPDERSLFVRTHAIFKMRRPLLFHQALATYLYQLVWREVRVWKLEHQYGFRVQRPWHRWMKSRKVHNPAR